MFGNFSTNGGVMPGVDITQLSTAIQGYWTRFAATGDPNGAAALTWAGYDPATDPYLELASPIVAGGWAYAPTTATSSTPSSRRD